MTNKAENNKRIAKNTVILYGRMLFMMFVGLYTSRVVIDALGFTDYGINNIVGSVVSMFTVLTSSLSGAVSRFFTFELGRGDKSASKREQSSTLELPSESGLSEAKEKLRTIFSMSVNILLIAGLVVAVVAEIGGVWYIHHKMVLPLDRIEAALWVFHCSVIGFVISLQTVPYDAAIVAHERMSVYAYMSILDALFKLLIAWAIVVSPFDKLISYAVLGLCVGILMRLIYWTYCRHCFAECRYRLVFDRNIFKSMGVFAGWNLMGSLAWMGRESGLNIVLNLFGGPVVNAARGIANTVASATRQLASSFMASSRPQITKTYAAGELDYSFSLVQQCTRLAFALILFFTLPLIIETHYVLSLWLVEVPKHGVWFVRLTLLLGLVESFRPALDTLIQATGKVKRDQIAWTATMLVSLPTAYLLMWLGFPPEITLVMITVAVAIAICIKLRILKELCGFPTIHYITNVCLRSLFAATVAAILPLALFFTMDESFLRLVLTVACSLTTTSISMLWLGCDKGERQIVFDYIKKILK